MADNCSVLCNPSIWNPGKPSMPGFLRIPVMVFVGFFCLFSDSFWQFLFLLPGVVTVALDGVFVLLWSLSSNPGLVNWSCNFIFFMIVVSLRGCVAATWESGEDTVTVTIASAHPLFLSLYLTPAAETYNSGNDRPWVNMCQLMIRIYNSVYPLCCALSIQSISSFFCPWGSFNCPCGSFILIMCSVGWEKSVVCRHEREMESLDFWFWRFACRIS